MEGTRIVAEGLRFPEGLVALPDGSTLFVAETTTAKPGAATTRTAAAAGPPDD